MNDARLSPDPRKRYIREDDADNPFRGVTVTWVSCTNCGRPMLVGEGEPSICDGQDSDGCEKRPSE